jgi:hypothetical protein
MLFDEWMDGWMDGCEVMDVLTYKSSDMYA